jgi:hypothetical protein
MQELIYKNRFLDGIGDITKYMDRFGGYSSVANSNPVDDYCSHNTQVFFHCPTPHQLPLFLA